MRHRGISASLKGDGGGFLQCISKIPGDVLTEKGPTSTTGSPASSTPGAKQDLGTNFRDGGKYLTMRSLDLISNGFGEKREKID